MNLAYHLVNVFTRDRAVLSGNPLCVFEDGNALSSAQMQALARQFNLSETTFLLRSTRADAGVRIFTPDFEMPFAGHPTLGTAHIVRRLAQTHGRQLQQLTLEMPAGIIPVRAEGDRWTLQANTATHRDIEYDQKQLSTALGLTPDALIWEQNRRPLWVNTGSEQLIVPLKSEAAVRNVAIDAAAIADLRSSQGRRMAMVFASIANDAVLARFFFESSGSYQEDPATGSACANLGGWFLATGHAAPLHRVVSQGEAVLRPATLRLGIDATQRIFVGGNVIYLGSGELQI